MWVQKHRPAALDDVIENQGQEKCAQLKQWLQAGFCPHLLFHGPPGTGKTSTALALANLMFPSSTETCCMIINASDDRGVSMVRNQVVPFASSQTLTSSGLSSAPVPHSPSVNLLLPWGLSPETSPKISSKTSSKKAPSIQKLIILDEADTMTTEAQGALRLVMEQQQTTRFVFIANNLDRLAPQLHSRCTLFHFRPLADEAILRALQRVALLEGAHVEAQALDDLVCFANGDLRKAIHHLQACVVSTDGDPNRSPKNVVTPDTVSFVTGQVSPAAVEMFCQHVRRCGHSSVTDLLRWCQHFAKRQSRAWSLAAFLNKFARHLVTQPPCLEPRLLGVLLEYCAASERRLCAGSPESLESPAFASLCTLVFSESSPI